MFFKPVDLTTALRPSLLQGESLLFVQDAVGLYEGWVACHPMVDMRSIGSLWLIKCERQ